jgi:hypothetical protein
MKQEKKAKRHDSRNTEQLRRDETVHERVQRHVRDKSSVITEEDIKNVKTELSIRGDLPLDKQPDQEK